MRVRSCECPTRPRNAPAVTQMRLRTVIVVIAAIRSYLAGRLSPHPRLRVPGFLSVGRCLAGFLPASDLGGQ